VNKGQPLRLLFLQPIIIALSIIPIIAANGDAVCCVVIFKGDSYSLFADWCLGIDIMIVPEKDENGNIIVGECNIGTEKYRPSRPTCFFCGKESICVFFMCHLVESVLTF